MLSIGLAVCHTGIELVFIYLEKVANKTDFMHYTIICFNGRFGFVPFTNHFSNRDASEDVVDYFNYDNISSNLCCLKFQLDYTFSNETVQSFIKSLTVMPFEENPNKRVTIVVGDCLRNISFENFLALLEVANQRVNLDIMNVDMLKLEGAEEAVESAQKNVPAIWASQGIKADENEDKNLGFLRLLATYKHPQLLNLVQKRKIKIEDDTFYTLVNECLRV